MKSLQVFIKYIVKIIKIYDRLIVKIILVGSEDIGFTLSKNIL